MQSVLFDRDAEQTVTFRPGAYAVNRVSGQVGEESGVFANRSGLIKPVDTRDMPLSGPVIGVRHGP